MTGMPERVERDQLAEALSELARTLQDEEGVGQTLQAIVEAAVGTVPGAEYAGVSMIEDRRTLATPAATDELVVKVDQAQYDTGQGPCLDALFEHRTVRVPDLAHETRWPAFVARAVALGVGSMLSFQLYVAGDRLGALNLYAARAGAFDDSSERVGPLFAAHAAVALAEAQKQQQLSQAMDTRDLIGQAKGILMERFRLTSDQAFALLVRASQRTNTKLRDIADHLVRSGELADRPRTPRPRPGQPAGPL
jgi:GAF domain-containing protein